MSTDPTWAAPAVADAEREVELGYAEHSRDALLRHGWKEAAGAEEGVRDEAPGPCPDAYTSLFGSAADDRALGAATRRLPPQERRVIRMRLSGHETVDTIAAALHLPPSSVASLLERGLSRIRHDLLT